jgi:hypothetical protein
MSTTQQKAQYYEDSLASSKNAKSTWNILNPNPEKRVSIWLSVLSLQTASSTYELVK